jgi:hypothetical protein
VLQVNTFLQTIAAQPPVISLGGYVTINRQLLIGVSRHFSAMSVCVKFHPTNKNGKGQLKRVPKEMKGGRVTMK